MLRQHFWMTITIMALAACGVQPAAQAPTEVTRVVVQEVTREVVRVETRVVVVTATPEPVTPTSEPTAAIEPTATPAPEPTAAPTAISALAPGEWVRGEIIRKIRIYDSPEKRSTRASPGGLHEGHRTYARNRVQREAQEESTGRFQAFPLAFWLPSSA